MAQFNKEFEQQHSGNNNLFEPSDNLFEPSDNGRVIGIKNLVGTSTGADHAISGTIDYKSPHVGEAIHGIHEISMLNELYFSDRNIQTLHDNIRYQVYIQSGKKEIISQQSDIHLKVIMRGIYLKFAIHDDNNVRDEIAMLNNFVIKTAVPQILGEISMHNSYIYEQEHLPVPIDHPRNVSSKGARTLEFSLRV
jgi:hypothetical protein